MIIRLVDTDDNNFKHYIIKCLNYDDLTFVTFAKGSQKKYVKKRRD